ncbi:MAG TPA: serine/threonine-protein kinase [Polyangiaceae bacterium]|nr:serine/threonine-protein kinase [Polyangiaceae bacterium]
MSDTGPPPWLVQALTQTVVEGPEGTRYYAAALIGEGGQGWVFRAHYDEPDGFWVVLKVLRPEGMGTDALRRFLGEADVLRKLGGLAAPSPNIVRLYDHGVVYLSPPRGEPVALPFMVLEYVDGETLASLIARSGGRGLPISRVRRLFRQVAGALARLHRARIVHRDLKPSNLIVAREGGYDVVKVTDFGLVKRFDDSPLGTVNLAGASVGYAPPEQYETGNPRVGPPTDVFSLALTLYEALSGAPGFPVPAGESAFQVLPRLLTAPRPQLAPLAARLPPSLGERPELVAALDRELARALQAQPHDRHPGVEAFWEAVEPVLREAEDPESTFRPDELEPYRISYEILPATPAPAPIPAPAPEPAPPASEPLPWQSLGPATLPGPARLVAFSPDGRTVLALVQAQLYRLGAGRWAPAPVERSLDLGAARGLRCPSPEQALVVGEQGLIARISAAGVATKLLSPDPSLTWLDVVLHPDEFVVLGERAGGGSLLGRLPTHRTMILQTLEAHPGLCAVARLGSGDLLLCGEGGQLVAVTREFTEPVSWARTGNLGALCPAPAGGAYVVGQGGHALSLSPRFEAKLEPVQTTRDLVCVAASEVEGTWAGGEAGRLLRRTAAGWLRVPLPEWVEGNILAVWAGEGLVRVALDDGLVLEGPAERLPDGY